VVLVDQAWTCNRPVSLALVKVTMRNAGTDAIFLRENCTGRIGRIEPRPTRAASERRR
jgi:hypothetical protein